MFPNSPDFPSALLPKRRKGAAPLPEFLTATNFSSGGNSHLAAPQIPSYPQKISGLGQKPPSPRWRSPWGKAKATRGLQAAAGQHHGQLRPLPPASFALLFFSHFLKILFLPHAFHKPLQSHSTAVFREEIIIVCFQVSKSRLFPKGSCAAKRSKIDVHVFSSSGGLRRGLGESLPAGCLQSRAQRGFLKADSLHAPPLLSIPLFPSRVFRSISSSSKLFKIKLHLLV